MTDNGYMNKNEDAIKKNRKAVKWSPRVSKDKLARLYKSTCQGIWDEQLIDDVGITLYLRCRDIVNIHRAQTERKVTCPDCLDTGTVTYVTREKNALSPMKCTVCGWTMIWPDYHRTFQRRQLNPGGAVKYFADFIRNYEKARAPKDKMLAIDLVIHEFHYSIRELPEQPARAAGVNLIDGKLTDVIAFLDNLGEMELPGTFRDQYKVWREKQNTINWDEIKIRRANQK